MSEVELRNVVKRYGATQVIHDVSLTVHEGEFAVFVGPSGSGKSTLLRMIAGLEDITDGEILIGGTPMNDKPPGKRDVAMVFQNYALYPHMTARQNMTFGLRNIGLPQDECDRRVEGAAALLRISELLDRKPSEMSGGQRQRVAIGRAITRQPKAFLFDEPLSNLDAGLRAHTRIELARLHTTIGGTMIFVTHDQVEAMTMADRIFIMNNGIVEQAGTPLELYFNPGNLFVAEFLGTPKMNVMPVRTSGAPGSWRLESETGGAIVTIGDQQDLGGVMFLGVRPEQVHLSGNGEGLTARVVAVEHLGSETLMHAALENETVIVARSDGYRNHSVGETVSLSFLPEECSLFDADGQAVANYHKATGATP